MAWHNKTLFLTNFTCPIWIGRGDLFITVPQKPRLHLTLASKIALPRIIKWNVVNHILLLNFHSCSIGHHKSPQAMPDFKNDMSGQSYHRLRKGLFMKTHDSQISLLLKYSLYSSSHKRNTPVSFLQKIIRKSHLVTSLNSKARICG